jgi:hypothetical protein
MRRSVTISVMRAVTKIVIHACFRIPTVVADTVLTAAR